MLNPAQSEQFARWIPSSYGEVEVQGEAAPARVGIVVPVFGRPQYVRRCLESLAGSDLRDCIVCLVDESVSDLSPPDFPGFEALSGLDSPGGDLGPLQGKTVPEIAAHALEMPDCVAFNSNGWLKSRLRFLPRRSPGLTLYIRSDRVPTHWRWFAQRFEPRPCPETSNLVRNWNPPGVRCVKIFKRRHGSMFDSLAHGWRLLAEAYGCPLLMSLDSDTLVKRGWVKRVVDVYDQNRLTVDSPMLVTGFHSPNHRTLGTKSTFRVKKSMGGLNMLFDLETWKDHVEPCLINLQWDSELCRKVNDVGGIMLATRPSVVQHIGRFGVWSGFFRFDRAWDY